uniref:ARAD1D16412p n=1 Tax=Blastobotrys adeninivorans TaxID=409370 RepID=A0A060TEP6_BLAAD
MSGMRFFSGFSGDVPPRGYLKKKKVFTALPYSPSLESSSSGGSHAVMNGFIKWTRPVIWSRLRWRSCGGRFVSTSGSLDGEYDRVLLKIATDHRTILRSHFEAQDQGKDGDNSLPIGTHEAEEIIKRAGSSLNSSYAAVTALRQQIPRERVDISVYNKFLRSVYGSSISSEIDYRAMFNSYLSLPRPAPLHILPQHLEDLLAKLMSRQEAGRANGRFSSQEWHAVFLGVLGDVVKCGMPVSLKEYTAAMQKIGRSVALRVKGEEIWPLIEEKYRELEVSGIKPDVTALNIMLAIALASRNNNMVTSVIEKYSSPHLKPDRYTLMLYMINQGIYHRNIDEVKRLYEDVVSGGFVVDMSIVNVFLKSLLNCGDPEGAEALLQSLLHNGQKYQGYPNNDMSHSTSNTKLVKKLHLMDYLISIVRQDSTIDPNLVHYEVPLVPDLMTFKIFLSYYCSGPNPDFSKVVYFFQLMASYRCYPTRGLMFEVLRAFRRQARSGTKDNWGPSQLNYIIDLICEYQQHSPENYYTYTMAHNAIETYAKVRGVRPPPQVTNLINEKPPETHVQQHKVHNVLRMLLN